MCGDVEPVWTGRNPMYNFLELASDDAAFLEAFLAPLDRWVG